VSGVATVDRCKWLESTRLEVYVRLRLRREHLARVINSELAHLPSCAKHLASVSASSSAQSLQRRRARGNAAQLGRRAWPTVSGAAGSAQRAACGGCGEELNDDLGARSSEGGRGVLSGRAVRPHDVLLRRTATVTSSPARVLGAAAAAATATVTAAGLDGVASARHACAV
jgi:hypothetical protein